MRDLSQLDSFMTRSTNSLASPELDSYAEAIDETLVFSYVV
jgi:hypothetical protein